MRRLTLRQVVVVCIITLLSISNLYAFELLLLDQTGSPVKDAYVAIPEGEVVEPSSEHQIMDQVNRQFVPHVLAVAQGQSVVFPNSDNIRHHVYSFSDAKKFEIELYQGVPKKPIQFDKAGLVALGCNIHDSMLGYILVSPWPEFTVTDDTGKVTLSKPVTKVAVWHPWLKGKTEPIFVNVEMAKGEEMATILIDLTKPKAVKQFKGFRKRYDD